jgi:hypothetical protein
MDEADRTEENAVLYSQTALYKSRRVEPDVTATGECLFCGEPVEQKRRWCDAQCRDDWEREADRAYEY